VPAAVGLVHVLAERSERTETALLVFRLLRCLREESSGLSQRNIQHGPRIGVTYEEELAQLEQCWYMALLGCEAEVACGPADALPHALSRFVTRSEGQQSFRIALLGSEAPPANTLVCVLLDPMSRTVDVSEHMLRVRVPLVSCEAE